MPAPRICGTCNQIHTGRCPTRTQRYGPEHQAQREAWEPLVATGTTWCARGQQIGEPHLLPADDPNWHLDHINGQSLPSCAHHNTQHSGRW